MLCWIPSLSERISDTLRPSMSNQPGMLIPSLMVTARVGAVGKTHFT